VFKKKKSLVPFRRRGTPLFASIPYRVRKWKKEMEANKGNGRSSANPSPAYKTLGSEKEINKEKKRSLK